MAHPEGEIVRLSQASSRHGTAVSFRHRSADPVQHLSLRWRLRRGRGSGRHRPARPRRDRPLYHRDPRLPQGFLAIRRPVGIADATSGLPARICRPSPTNSAPLRETTGMPVTLVGWSRGGIIAREAARLAPDATRMVVTLGSPLRCAGCVECRPFGGASPARLSPPRRRSRCAPLPHSCRSRAPRSIAVQTASWPGGRACRRKDLKARTLRCAARTSALASIPPRSGSSRTGWRNRSGAWTPFRPSPVVARLFPWSE